MIYGKISDGRAIIPVVFRLPSQPDFNLNYELSVSCQDFFVRIRITRILGFSGLLFINCL